MGNITEIIELQAKVDRKDAYIDKLELQLAEVSADRDQRGELSARLFSENQTLRHQLNDKQLEVDHCRTCCDELRGKLDQMKLLATTGADALIATARNGLDLVAQNEALTLKVKTAGADALDAEADLIMAAPAVGGNWTPEEDRIARKIGSMMKTRAALLRAGGV